MNRRTFNNLITTAQFDKLFIEEMGWNNPQAPTKLPVINIDDVSYQTIAVAARSDFKVLTCTVDVIPMMSVCRKLDLKIRNFTNEYICIFIQRNSTHHLWMAPVRKVDKRDIVLTEYENADKADAIYQKIDGISFGVDERTLISDVRDRINSAFIVNSEKITKDFYAGFKKEHNAFTSFISGIDDDIADKNNRNKQWYASVMLNRLMFCYFIQKKGFLDNNVHYLREKLEWSKQERGHNKFFKDFYVSFLKQLFHDGLNAPKHSDNFEKVFGRVPYLNGGMFDEHQLERDYADLDIADEAFERLFAFFDKWNWHLDTRITASGKDINPDVLGYIFEQYINDRAQMGAYYTKEDITEYIGRNCILPYLFDETSKASEKAAKDFEPDGYVWQSLRASGDRYIFDAVKQGYTSDWRNQIPQNIAVGIDTTQPNLLERRKDWNNKTDDRFALPTEIWRETIERLQRCENILCKISGGEITHINDFITYNLDIRSFAHDLLAHASDHLFVGHFYHALQRVTILDPTCGSGAFLFAALNILEPLYEVCIDRMQEFNHQNPNLFKDELAEISNKYRSNIQYFIYKSIILRNLYGVDIMVEATEIAKLRLFLKMVAVVEVDRRAPNLGLDPLPDIDFNIRCGNTLVGYATEEELNRDLIEGDMFANAKYRKDIEEEMRKVASAYEMFKGVQLSQAEDMASFKQAKRNLAERLTALNEKLNQRLYAATSQIPYDKWLESHQPFHWLAEFYQIIQGNGGFDVIIGNPPYVTFTDNSLNYSVRNFYTYETKNLFALCGERFVKLVHKKSSIGYIIPLSGMSIDGFDKLQKVMYQNCDSWNSFYSGDRNPSELFTGVKIRAGIYISRRNDTANNKYVCRYLKYAAIERHILFCKLNYTEIKRFTSAPKIPSRIGLSIINKVQSFNKTLKSEFKQEDTIFYHAAPIHWCKCLSNLSALTKNNLNIADSYKKITTSSHYRDFVFTLLNSTLFFYYWIVMSDCYNLTKKYFEIGIPSEINEKQFSKLAENLNKELIANMQIAEYEYKNRGKVRFAQFFPKKSKSVIDAIDSALASYYGFTEEELDFIINYDIKYRMGDELNSEE